MNFQLVPTAPPQVLEEDFGVEASLFFWKNALSPKRTAKALKKWCLTEIPFSFVGKPGLLTQRCILAVSFRVRVCHGDVWKNRWKFDEWMDILKE